MIVIGKRAHREDSHIEVFLEETIAPFPSYGLSMVGPAQGGLGNTHKGGKIQGIAALGKLVK